MPLLSTKGAASASGLGFTSSSGPVNYIEDVFSTYLYTGNSSTQTITNGIDLAGEGGLVWTKKRSASEVGRIYDSARGTNKNLIPSLLNAEATDSPSAMTFTGSGFSLINDNSNNTSGSTYASWTFRKQPKFFDIVTYTGNGASGRSIAHNLGSTPGCIIIKSFSNTERWTVYHRSLTGVGYYLDLSETSAETNLANGISSVTSTSFTIGSNDRINSSGQTFVVYIFAHDAGGFGLTGLDNVISCGSYTGDGAATKQISLGYEPQWVMVKNASSATNWLIVDQMRGMPAGTDNSNILNPNLTNAESSNNRINTLSATGFLVQGAAAETNASSATYIYIAIRRGPMAVPTVGTSVFAMAENITNSVTATAGFPVDAFISTRRSGVLRRLIPRLTNQTLVTNTTAGEVDNSTGYSLSNNTGVLHTTMIDSPNFWWMFKRARSFMDVVCSAGTSSSNQARTHNLGVTPELMFVKDRSSGATNWTVYVSSLGQNAYLNLNNTNNSQSSSGVWGTTTNTATTFYCNDTGNWCATVGNNGVFYLFATCPGVSKVGSYTGTATTKQIECGFTAGARFVLIKRTDSTGDWYVWDTTRGIISGNDPYLLLNNEDAEVTNTDYIDTYSAGFELSSTAPAAINANGGSYIFLAIA